MPMPLTEEERKFLQSDEGKKPMPLSDAERAFMAGEKPPEVAEPTTTEKAQHVGARWLSGVLDVADMPAYIREGSETVSGYFPKAAEIVGKHPYVKYGKAMREAVLPDQLTGEARATETVPGLTQARELSDEYTLSPEQLEQAPVTRAVGTGAEWVGVPGVSAASQAVKGGVKAIPDALSVFSREAATSGGMAAGAATGSEIGRLAGGDEGSAAGELIGGLSGILVALKTGKVEQLTKAQRDMLNALRNRFDNEAEMVATVQQALDAGDIGTLTDLTGSRGLANIEAALDRTPVGSKAIEETLDKRVEKIYEDTVGITGKDIPEAALPQSSAAAAARQVETADADIQAQAGQRLTQAAEQAEREADMLRREAGDAWTGAEQRQAQAGQAADQARAVESEIVPPLRPDQYSTSAAGKYAAAETDHKAATRALWDEFDQSGNIAATPYKADADDFLRAMDPAEQDALLQKYGKYFTAIDEFQSNVSPRALSLRIQQMKADINNAAKQGTFGWEEKTLQGLVDRFEDMLVSPTTGSPAYRAAVEATKEGHDRFGPAYIKDVRKAEPEEFLGAAGLQGDRGAATARLFNESKIPELQEDVANRILAEAGRKKTLDDQFLIDYEAVLDNLDAGGYDTRAKLVAMIDAQDQEASALAKAKAAEEAAEKTSRKADVEQGRLSKALDAQEQAIKTEQAGLQKANQSSLLAQYGEGFEQADKVVDDLLLRPDGPARLRALVDDMVALDAPQGGTAVMDSFRARVRDRLNATLFEPPKAGKAPVQAKQALKNYRTMQRRLVDANLLDADDAKYLDSVLARAETELLRMRGKATIGDVASSNTEQSNLLSSVFASALLAPLPGAYNLQLGGAVRRYFKTGLEVKPTKRNIEALTEYMTNPEAFLKGIEKLKTPAARAEFVLTKLVGAGQAAEILAAKEEEE